MKSFIHLDDLTDHLPILVSTDLHAIDQTCSPTLIRDTKHFNRDALNENLFENLITLGNADKKYINNYMENFISIFTSTLNSHAPMHRQTQREKKLNSKP